MTTYTDRTTASDDEFQREVIERFGEVAPAELREAVARWLAPHLGLPRSAGMSDREIRVAADGLCAVFAEHLGQQQAAIQQLAIALAEYDAAAGDAPRRLAVSMTLADCAERVVTGTDPR